MSDHHHGVFKTLRKPYATYWVPFLFWFGEKVFDGRVNAGQASHYSRVVRFAANVLTLAVIGIYISENGYEDFMHDGAEMDFASTATTTAAMAVNMIAVLVGSAANHHKIQQSYDAQISWQELKNERDNTNNTVPHGFDKDVPSEIKCMQTARYLHDANGFAGSLLSLIVFAAYISEECGPGSFIAMFTLGVMFLASRASAVLSVVCVPFTTDWRLGAYKNWISKQAKAYCREESINNALREISYFKKEILSREEELLYASCYRACEIYNKTIDPSKIKKVIDNYYESDVLMIKKMKCKSPLMDALCFIEADVLAALSGNEKTKTFEVVNDPATKLLREKLKARGMKEVNEKLWPYMTKDASGAWRIDKAEVSNGIKSVTKNPHGDDQFVMGRDTDKLVKIACGG